MPIKPKLLKYLLYSRKYNREIRRGLRRAVKQCQKGQFSYLYYEKDDKKSIF